MYENRGNELSEHMFITGIDGPGGYMLVALLMGFACGLPLLLTGTVLQAWMKEQGVDITVIGMMSPVGLPYKLKFLWAPLLDRFTLPFLGRRIGDTEKANPYIGYDYGIASQSILLGAREKGLAGCMFGSINRQKLGNILNINKKLKILLVIAIGKPKEEVVIETVGPDNNIRY